MDRDQIEHWFTYHAPTPEQLQAYEELRSSAKQFAHIINKYLPDCEDKSAAIRLVREATMTANAAIACGGK